MDIDLLAGRACAPVPAPLGRAPTILVLDSGLGGLTVHAELRRVRPDARFVYAADDAAFPVGRLDEGTLRARVVAVMERLLARHAPDLVVVACNTISTLVLPALRARFAVPFVGVVPPIKPAAAATRSGLVTVLATPGTVRRDYTRDLIATYAGACRVHLVGSARFAPYAEAELRGEPVSDAAIAAEFAPCFVEADGRRTDVVVLGCTHYPLLRARLMRAAPWPVTYLDPAPAVARRVAALLGPAPERLVVAGTSCAVFTDGATVTPVLRAALAQRALAEVEVEPLPLTLH
jgi:glutamate racemase